MEMNPDTLGEGVFSIREQHKVGLLYKRSNGVASAAVRANKTINDELHDTGANVLD